MRTIPTNELYVTRSLCVEEKLLRISSFLVLFDGKHKAGFIAVISRQLDRFSSWSLSSTGKLFILPIAR